MISRLEFEWLIEVSPGKPRMVGAEMAYRKVQGQERTCRPENYMVLKESEVQVDGGQEVDGISIQWPLCSLCLKRDRLFF